MHIAPVFTCPVALLSKIWTQAGFEPNHTYRKYKETSRTFCFNSLISGNFSYLVPFDREGIWGIWNKLTVLFFLMLYCCFFRSPTEGVYVVCWFLFPIKEGVWVLYIELFQIFCYFWIFY